MAFAAWWESGCQSVLLFASILPEQAVFAYARAAWACVQSG